MALNLSRRAMLAAPALALAGPVLGQGRTYRNPIVPGFYPDPSIARRGEDYFLVNSSFEYFPGVPLWHSRDLTNWRQIGHCLTRVSQLDLRDTRASDGIYAPTLRVSGGRMYMSTTVNHRGALRNFFVWTDDPFGDWSEPVWIDQGGIDPSLLFAENGEAYWLGNGTRWAPVRGAYQSRVDIRTGQRLTTPKLIWEGSGGAYPEGPRMFRRGGYYYLILAEGGTYEGHMVTIARSRSPEGPFEPCPSNPILTHRSLMNPVRATGHADLFEDHRGAWWAVFLGIRYTREMHFIGRETFLAPVTWRDDWPVVNGGRPIGETMTVEQALPAHPWPEDRRDPFALSRLPPDWVHVRNPIAANYRLEPETATLRLQTRGVTLRDEASPSFVGRRLVRHRSAITVEVDLAQAKPGAIGGLAARMNERHHLAVLATMTSDGPRVSVARHVGDLGDETAPTPVPASSGRVKLILEITPALTRAGWIRPDGSPVWLGQLDTRYLSTEVSEGYTGLVCGPYAVETSAAARSWIGFSGYRDQALD
ncbi:glycoside hydrolase family 43 protein [uncultured Caulobacter sp.]|uniref:glycoside hydrolase family 43 protein n=1 Tax=uncultured Caulobacter sp. TaxID=158749 RepID=UPI0026040557|nr:glycoside hydrolase family 43 protein [uncultured Caulobacter sp.]